MEKKETYQEKLKKQFQPWEDYTNMAYKWRGEVINHAIDLEQIIEIFISKHYIIGVSNEDYDQKLNDFKRVFFWEIRMPFGNKMTIAKSLIELYQPDIHKMYPEVNVLEELDEIIQTRNAMAHWQLDFSREYRWNGAKNKQIKIDKLNKIKKATKKELNIYSEDSVKQVVDLCRKYTTIFLHWSEYPMQKALSTIYFATEDRMKNLTDLERTLFREGR